MTIILSVIFKLFVQLVCYGFHLKMVSNIRVQE